MVELLGSSEEETRNKESKLEAITKATLGKKFETYSIEGFPYIFSIYSKEKDQGISGKQPIACIHINKNLISLKNKDYLRYITELKEKYYNITKQEWTIDEDYE